MAAITKDHSPDDWLYFKLYVGSALGKVDNLLVDTISKVIQLDGLVAWYFLRYFDESGMHLRLRVKPIYKNNQILERQLKIVCSETISNLHNYLPSNYYPMVTYNWEIEEMATPSDARLVMDRYEPEYDKFGGGLGMQIAEWLFTESSELVYNILRLENEGVLSRKSLLPSMMNACFKIFKSGEEPEKYWRQYGLYWLGGDTPVAHDWIEKFLVKGQELKDQGVDVLKPSGHLPPEAVEVLQSWEASLNKASELYSANLPESEIPRDSLCFNFMHLMNNRLGIMPLEEAYIANLIEHSAVEYTE